MDNKKPEVASEVKSSEAEAVDNDRRAFFRSAALAAGAVSVIGATLGVEEAHAAPAATKLRLQRSVVKAGFDGNAKVSIEHIYQAIEQMLDIAGCPTCGLVGFDLNLRINPVERLKIEIPATVEVE